MIGHLEAAEARLGGTLGVYGRVLSPEVGPPVRYREHERFPAASTIKVFILLSLLELVEGGGAALDEQLTVTREEQVTGSGVLKSLPAPRSCTLLELATLMIIVSDNTATNLLIDRVGDNAINDLCHRHRWNETHLAGKLQRGGSGTSTTSPFDLGDFFERLWLGQLLGNEHTRVAREIFGKQQYTDQLGRYIGYDPYSTEIGESALAIASKSGSIRGVRNDAGVIRDGNFSFALGIMTKDCTDLRFHSDNLGSLVVSTVTAHLFERFKGEQ